MVQVLPAGFGSEYLSVTGHVTGVLSDSTPNTPRWVESPRFGTGMLLPSPSPMNAVPFCHVPKLRPPSAHVAFRFHQRTNSQRRFGLVPPPSASDQPVGQTVRLKAITAPVGTVLRFRSSRFADIWFQSVLVSCCHVETVPSDEKAALAIAAKPIAETIPAPIFNPFRNSEGFFTFSVMGLLFYAVDRRHVLWSGFVSSGGGRHVSAIPSIGEPRVVRTSGNAYAMTENSRIYRFVVV